MAFGGPSKGVKNDINVTPLVDVVLVLLIIFMVVTPMLQRDEKVHLPKARNSEETKSPEALIVALPADHSIWIDSKPVPANALEATLTAAVHKDPERKLVIKGDETLRVKDVSTVLAAATAAGAKGVSLAVDEVKK
ncbi:MAG: biopolymer transporter ExbD [Polyangiales bacterium]